MTKHAKMLGAVSVRPYNPNNTTIKKFSRDLVNVGKRIQTFATGYYPKYKHPEDGVLHIQIMKVTWESGEEQSYGGGNLVPQWTRWTVPKGEYITKVELSRVHFDKWDTKILDGIILETNLGTRSPVFGQLNPKRETEVYEEADYELTDFVGSTGIEPSSPETLMSIGFYFTPVPEPSSPPPTDTPSPDPVTSKPDPSPPPSTPPTPEPASPPPSPGIGQASGTQDRYLGGEKVSVKINGAWVDAIYHTDVGHHPDRTATPHNVFYEMDGERIFVSVAAPDIRRRDGDVDNATDKNPNNYKSGDKVQILINGTWEDAIYYVFLAHASAESAPHAVMYNGEIKHVPEANIRQQP